MTSTPPLPNALPSDDARRHAGNEMFNLAKTTAEEDTLNPKGFETLHILSIQYYQRDLCRLSHDLVNTGGIRPSEEKEKLKELRTLLQDYSNAVKSLETTLARDAIYPKDSWVRKDLVEDVESRTKDQKRIDSFWLEQHTYEVRKPDLHDPIRTLLHRVFPRRWKYGFNQIMQRERHMSDSGENGIAINMDDLKRTKFDEKKQFAPSKVVDTCSRVVLTVVGGASLLVPMIIMTYAKSQPARLATVSAAVIIFGIVLSLCSTKASNQELLGATAAYTAVMVVYVGSTTN